MGAILRFALTMALWIGQGCPDAHDNARDRHRMRDNQGEESARHESHRL